MTNSLPSDVVHLPLHASVTPLQALERLRLLGHLVLLENCTGGRSLLAAAPRAVFRWTDGRGAFGPAAGPVAGIRREIDDPLAVLGGLLSGRPGGRSVPGVFTGGWIGYLGYEVADTLERLPPGPDEGDGLPTIWWGAYDWAVVWGPGAGAPRLEGACLPGGDLVELRDRMDDARARLEDPDMQGGPGPGGEAVTGPGDAPPAPGPPPVPGPLPAPGPPPGGASPPRALTSSLGRHGFSARVERIRELIRAGDVFQANLTHRLSAPWPLGGYELYRRMRRQSPASYAAYLDTGEGEVVSVSPESFLSLRGRRVETRPIKGTAPRHPDPETDEALARSLLESEKDRAENVMIVDLLRNDLSRVCRPGSIRVPNLLELESHPTVHHLVSTVEGELADGVGPIDLLRAAFPGGSITGAPKIRAMEILRGLEPVRRGVYTGALGIVEAGGDMELSIAIRTATVRQGTAHFGTGGGITLASDPEAEWRESLDKAAPFLHALGIPAESAASLAHEESPETSK